MFFFYLIKYVKIFYMDKIIKNVLKKIESEGYEAYIVGGFVRDLLLYKNSFDVDICTNAKPKDLINVFSAKQKANNYGGFNIKIKNYNIDITTYRKEKAYSNRHPIEIEYVSNLFEDIKRRDFTINAICMDKNEKIIDLLNGKEDINDGIIRSIGSAEKKFKEDPLRMLRAIRFASILNFDIEKNTYKEICNNCTLVSSLSKERVKEELIKILSNKNFKKGLELLKETGISDVIGLSYNEDITFTLDILGMLSQIDIKYIEYTKEEKDNIEKIKEILMTKQINNFTIFNYGLYLSYAAGEVLNINKQTINRIYKTMPIKCMKDIDITGSEIIKLLGIEPSKKISEIFNDLKVQILKGNLKNKNNEIKKYILERYKHE